VVAVQAVTVVQFTVTSDVAANPVPEKSTVEPTGPVAGVEVREGVTVNTAVTKFPAASVPVKTCGPTEEFVRTKVHSKLPVELVVELQAVPLLQVTVTATAAE